MRIIKYKLIKFYNTLIELLKNKMIINQYSIKTNSEMINNKVMGFKVIQYTNKSKNLCHWLRVVIL